MIDKFTVLGERCSGTNFLESVIKKNFNLEATYQKGWKHFFGFNEFMLTDDTLFIGIVRAPYEWMSCLYEHPHHLQDELRVSMDNFLNKEFWSYYDDEAEHTNLYGQEIMEDRNMNTKERYKNIFECRYMKMNYLVNVMPMKVKNYVFLRYEDLRDDYENVLKKIKNDFKLQASEDYGVHVADTEVNHLGRVRENKILTHPDFNEKLESALGYVNGDHLVEEVNLDGGIKMNFEEKRLLLKPDFCFYHIPKCGGSTVRATLFDFFSTIYKESEIYYPENSPNQYNFYTESEFREFIDHKTPEQLSQIKILLCHVKYNSLNISDKFGDHTSAIILRNPTSRIISHYEFFDYPTTKVHMNKLSKDQLEEYCIRMSSVMTSFLSRNIDVSKALDNIRKIDFVGDVLNIDDFIEQITKFYCEKFDLVSYKQNVITRNTNKNKIIDRKLAKKVGKIISESNDQNLYNQFVLEK